MSLYNTRIKNNLQKNKTKDLCDIIMVINHHIHIYNIQMNYTYIYKIYKYIYFFFFTNGINSLNKSVI